jgi:NHLM bacteriocin system ABC transporter ATP-binding protein
MSTALLPQLCGMLLHADPTHPLAVDDPDKTLAVWKGSIDVYAVEINPGEVGGARHHLLRMGKGDTWFGLRSKEYGISLLAVPSPDTRLFQGSMQSFRELTHNEYFAAYAIDTIDRWLKQISSSVLEALPPKALRIMSPGETVTDIENPIAVTSLGVVWIKAVDGAASLNGELSIDCERPFPVTRSGWVVAPPNTTLRCISTAQAVADRTRWSAMDSFHGVICQALSAKLARQRASVQKRVRERSEADATILDRALRQLSASASTRKSVINEPSTHAITVPALEACQAVAEVSGIRLRSTPKAVECATPEAQIEAIAAGSSVRLRRVVLKGQWWKQQSGPLVAVRETDNVPVALLPIRGSRYRLYESSSSIAKAVDQEVASELKPFAYTFYRPFPAQKLTILDLLKFAYEVGKRELLILLLLGIALGLQSLLVPIITGLIFDVVIPGADHRQLLAISALLLASALSAALFVPARGFVTLRLETKIDSTVQAAVWDRLLSLPAPFFRNYTSGDLAQRSMGINQIRQILMGSTVQSILSSLSSLFSAGLLFYYNIQLGVLAAVLSAIAFGFSTLCGVFELRYQRVISTIAGKLSGTVLQLINGIAKLRVSGSETRGFSVWARDFAKQRAVSVKARRLMNWLSVFNSFFPPMCLILVYHYGSQSIQNGVAASMTTGQFLAFLAAFGQLLRGSMELSSVGVSVLGIIPLHERARPILEALPEVTLDRTEVGTLSGAVEFSHVTFRYFQDSPPVLHDVSFSVNPGEFLAIVGSSGSGKSTLLRILLGFEAPEVGSVYYDGQDLASLDVQSLRQQIGVVLQNGSPMRGDILTNIVGSLPLTLADAWEAARLAGLDADIRQMPMGMHTVIGEAGGGLSGGQRQRLMIARAIVAKPRIILFDEATSALDNQTQTLVSRSLEALRVTRIVIAHRLSTIINADCIVVLEKGRLVQEGTYTQLVKRDGPFKALAQRQLV